MFGILCLLVVFGVSVRGAGFGCVFGVSVLCVALVRGWFVLSVSGTSFLWVG